jgi:predicted phage terminase large subunit-like protein
LVTTPSEVTKTDVELELIRRDFEYYCKAVHNRPLYDHQKMWIREIAMPMAKTLIVAPPESLKSSTIRMRIEWEIGNNPEMTILLVMNTSAQAQKQVMSIAETIETNELYRKVFPWVTPNRGRGWSHEVLFIKRQNESRPDPTLYGTGIDGPYQGSHVDMLVVDDPTDQQDVRSSSTMEAQRDRLKGVLRDRLVEGGKFFAILTRWGEADLVPTFRDMDFTVLENPIEGRYPWGRLLCPELFHDERIERLKREKGSGLYSLTYQCDPAAALGSKIKREWWRYYADKPEVKYIVHSWDLSTGRKGGDYTGFGAWGLAEDGYYLMDGGTWHLTMDDLIKKMKLLYEQQRPRWVIVEDAGTSIPVIQYLQRHTNLPLKPVKPGARDKEARLDGIIHLIEAGRVWIPATQPWVKSFVDECSTFPGGSNDDQVDQMTQALTFMESRPVSTVSGGGAFVRV